MPGGILGMNAESMSDYLKFIANRRLTQIGLEEEFLMQLILFLGCLRSGLA